MPGTHVSHRSPVTRGRQLHCPLRGSQAACRAPSAEQWQAGGTASGWVCGGARPPAPPAARTLTGTGGEAVVAGAALLAGGARVAGAAATQPARPADLVQGALGVAAAGCEGQRVRPRHPWVRPRPARAPAPAHRGSRGSRGSRGGSGRSEARRTRAGTGSGPPRRSPRAGSLRGCSRTLWSRGVRGLSGAAGPAPRPPAPPRGGLTHAGTGGSGSSRGRSGRTRSPRSLPGTGTGPSPGHSRRPPLRGQSTGRLQGDSHSVRAGQAPATAQAWAGGGGLDSRWQPGP